jgi:hypothetical protein
VDPLDQWSNYGLRSVCNSVKNEMVVNLLGKCKCLKSRSITLFWEEIPQQSINGIALLIDDQSRYRNALFYLKMNKHNSNFSICLCNGPYLRFKNLSGEIKQESII